MASNNGQDNSVNRRIPDFKRLTKEDFPEKYRDLIEKLALPINSHFEQVRNLFNGNIGIEHLTQEVKVIDIQTGTDGSPINDLKFKTNLTSRVCGIIPISATVTSATNTYLNQTPFISFSQSANIVTITNISGLSPETRYSISFLVLS